MFSKKGLFIAVAITFVILLFVFISSHLHAISCTGRSECGSCTITNCSTGGCVSSAGGHGCTCDGETESERCPEEE